MPRRYHPLLVTLLWLLALMVLLSLLAGSLLLDGTPNGDPSKVGALRIRMILGVTTGALMLIRLVVRARTSQPPAATTGITLADRLVPLAHWALYLLVLAMVGSGITPSIQSGLPEAVFGTASLAATYADFSARAAHGVIASLVMAVIGLHVLAVVFHLVVRHDGLLSRMGFGRG